MSADGRGGRRLTVLDALEGMYVAEAVDFLHREGILAELGEGADLTALAAAHGFEATALAQLVEYVALRCDVVERVAGADGARYAASAAYRDGSGTAHLLDQYAGAFAPALRRFGEVLRAPDEAGRFVDRARHAAAYADGRGRSNAPEVRALVGELGIRTLLDVGCGGAQLLAELAAAQPQFCGIGIDANPAVVASAQRMLVERGLQQRVEVLCGDVAALGTLLSAARRASVDALAAVSVANAFAAGRPGRTIEDFLRTLQALFPNRFLFVCDYYGRLGAVCDEPERFRRTLLHDLAQVASGEGVPPPNLDAWRAIYERAGCTLAIDIEDESGGIARFVHLVQL